MSACRDRSAMQPLPESRVQRVEIHRLADPVVAVAGSPLGAAPRVAGMDPVGVALHGSSLADAFPVWP
jgi:hypothetical protein